MMNELLLLKLRNAIVQKEAIVANMNRDTTCRDGWSCDWNSMFSSEMDTIAALLEEIESVNTRG